MPSVCSHKERNLIIDALPLIFQGGISNYVKPLVQSLLEHKGSNLQVELLFRLSLHKQRSQLYKTYVQQVNSNKNFHFTTHWPDRLLDWFWSHGLSCSYSHDRCLFFLATTEMVPRKGAVKVGWIVYDLIPLRIPRFFPGNPEDYRAKMRELSRRTDFIVTISQNTKEDLVQLIDYPDDRILVLYPGVTSSEGFISPPSLPEGRPYIYYLGSLALNKNVDGMLRIFSACVNRHGLDLDLVLTGKDFCGPRFWDRLIRELHVEGRVHMTGWIPDQLREGYLQNATMLWQFSWYEGFGLPVLEAASRGIPVLYANRGSLPEILDNAEQEIDPADEPAAIARAVLALQSPSKRAQWGERGLERSRLFSWSESSLKLLRHLENLG